MILKARGHMFHIMWPISLLRFAYVVIKISVPYYLFYAPLFTFYIHCLQASQSGYTVDYATQGGQGAFPSSFLNQNSQAGYSRFGSGNEFMSQVCSS